MKTDLKEVGAYFSRDNQKKDISVIIPIYNEEGNISPLNLKLKKVLDSLNLNYEIIFIDDGSSDDSFAQLCKAFEESEFVKVIQLGMRYGKSAALYTGFQHANGDIIISIDGDLQDDPDEIPNLIEKLNEGYDLVSGWKFIRHDPISKTIPSKIFNKVTSFLTRIKLHDFNSGFKAYRKEVAKNINIYGELHRYIPVLAHCRGYKVSEIKVNHYPRYSGESKYGANRFFRGFFDLLTILFLTKYTKRPLHLFGSIGLVFFMTGLVFNIYLTVLKILGEAIGHRPLLFLGVLLMIVGIQISSTGLVCELITSTNHKDDPDYLVKRILDK